MTRPHTFQGCFVIGGLGLATNNLLKYEASNSTHYEDTKGDTKYQNGVF